VQTVLHYTNELFVTELIIVIHIKYLENGVDQVTGQFKACCDIHRSSKLIWKRESDTHSEDIMNLLNKTNTQCAGQLCANLFLIKHDQLIFS